MDRAGLILLIGARLSTAVAMSCMSIMFGYALLTMGPTQTFVERWPSLRHYRRHVLGGLWMMVTGWAIHQWFWWGHDSAKARGAFRLMARLAELSPLVSPVHAVIIGGAILSCAPMAAEVFGARWLPASFALAVAFVVLGAWLVV